jgi:hypothetical protein
MQNTTATAFVKRPENAYCRIATDTSLARVDMHISKKEKNRCNALEDFKVPNKIQPQENFKGQWHRWRIVYLTLGRERELELVQPLLER